MIASTGTSAQRNFLLLQCGRPSGTGVPLAPSRKQPKIQAERGRIQSQSARITFKLRAVAFVLAVEKALGITAFVDPPGHERCARNRTAGV